MTFNTGNPIGSTDARDLSDNAENFDKALGTLSPTWTDRLGVTRDSFEGRLAKGSFYRVGTFAKGYTLTNMRQTLEYNGHEYSWAGTFPKVVSVGATPETTGGIGAGAWVDRSDVTLRSEISAIDGAGLIGAMSYAQLRAYSGPHTTVNVLGISDAFDGAAGVFKVNSSDTTSADNGGTILVDAIGRRWYRVFSAAASVLWFGAKGDGVTDDTQALLAADAHSVATGELIRISGQHNVKNVQLGGRYVFDNGAYIYGLLGERDNIILAKPGLRMFNARFKKELSAWAVDGDFGNAIRIGSYRQPNDGSAAVYDVELYNTVIENIGTAFTSQSIEVLGDVYRIKIHGLTIIGAGAGIICHWGGDVGDAGAHNSVVTYSYHPHNLSFRDFYFGPDSLGNAPSNPCILSSCYDVDAVNIQSLSVLRTLSIFPGDVYNEVAVSRDKGKPLTGIRVRGVHCVDPVNGQAAVEISGIPATKRTAAETYYGRDAESRMDIQVTGVNITCKDIVYTNQLVMVRGCKNVVLDANKSGGELSTANWAYLDYNESCQIRLNGVSVSGERLRGNTNCRMSLNGERTTLTAMSSDDSGCSIESFVIGTLSLAAAAVGATTVTATLSGADGIIFNGSYIMVGGEPVAKVMKSVLLKAGVGTTIKVAPLRTEITDGTSATAVLPHEGTRITGTKKGFLYNYRVTNAWGLRMAVESINGYRGGMLISGDYARDVDVSQCTFEGTGLENSTPSRFDINLVASKVRNFRLTGNSFDGVMQNPLVSQRFAMRTTDHAGVVIAGNRGTPTIAGVAFSLDNSTVAAAYSMQQIFDNVMGELVAPIGTVVGQYVGNGYRGIVRNNALPTSGYFSAGDKLDRGTIAAGWQEGWVCSVSGAPGAWLGRGSVSA